jgi:hypothetical protein
MLFKKRKLLVLIILIIILAPNAFSGCEEDGTCPNKQGGDPFGGTQPNYENPEAAAEALKADPSTASQMEPEQLDNALHEMSEQERINFMNNYPVSKLPESVQEHHMASIRKAGKTNEANLQSKKILNAFKASTKETPAKVSVEAEAVKIALGEQGYPTTIELGAEQEITFEGDTIEVTTPEGKQTFGACKSLEPKCGIQFGANGRVRLRTGEEENPETPPAEFQPGNFNVNYNNYPKINIEGRGITVETTLPPNRNLLTGKLTMEGSSNITLGRDKKTFDKVRDGQIETEDINGRYKTSLKDAEDITIYSNGTYTIGHAEVLELHTDKNGKKDRIIVVNGNDISFDGNELKVGSSDSIIINERTIAVNPEDFYGYISYNGYPGYPIIPKELSGDFLDFRFNSSDAVIIGDRTYPNLKDSEFLLDGELIAYANLSSKADDNSLYFTSPIDSDSDIILHLDSDESVELITFDERIELRSYDKIEAEISENIFRTLQPKRLLGLRTPLEGTMLAAANNNILELFFGSSHVTTADDIFVRFESDSVKITLPNETVYLDTVYHIEDEAFSGLEFSLRAYNGKVEVATDFELISVYSSDEIWMNSTTVKTDKFSYSLPLVPEKRVNVSVFNDSITISDVRLENLSLKHGTKGFFEDVYIVINSHDDLGIDIDKFDSTSDYLITVFRPVTFYDSAVIVNEGEHASVAPAYSKIYEGSIDFESSNFSYAIDGILDFSLESYIVIDKDRFNLQNGEYVLRNDDNIETVYSPGLSEAKTTDKGIKCVILSMHSSYFFSGLSILSDFGIEAKGSFFHLCMRKQKEDTFDKSCFRCGVIDFIDNKMSLNNEISYYRYPFKEDYPTSVVFYDVYTGFEQAYSEFKFDKNMKEISDLKLTSTLFTRDAALTKALLNV